MKKALRKFLGFISACIGFFIVSQGLIAIGPVVAGIVIGMVNAAPNPQLAKTLESVGLIFNLVVSFYLSIKIYKKISGTGKLPVDKTEI